ncbi:MAG: hypothetical protein M3P06_11485 [Acidobacteriota bacterium]|nr:hypothetical protein [Acidobacteriota bacterium]
MTWRYRGAYGGESQDVQMERVDVVRSSAVTIGTTAGDIVSGSRHLTFPTATDAAKAIIPIDLNNEAVVQASASVYEFSGWVRIDGTLSAEVGLLSNATQGGTRYIRIGTDGTLRLYNSSGVQLGYDSRDKISDSAPTHFRVTYDYVSCNGNANMAYVNVFVAGRWQWDGLIFTSAQPLLETDATTMCWGEWLAAATNRGANLVTDDLCFRSMADETDITYAPAVLPYYQPAGIFQLVGGSSLPATGDGSQTAWTLSDGGAADYTRINESPNNGDTSWIGSTTNSQKETYVYAASNPTDSGDTIVSVQMRGVERVTGGAKGACRPILRDPSANESFYAWTAPGTSYVGVAAKAMPRPAGGSWVTGDFDAGDLEFGIQALGSGTIGVRVTAVPGPEILKHEAVSPHQRYFA